MHRQYLLHLRKLVARIFWLSRFDYDWASQTWKLSALHLFLVRIWHLEIIHIIRINNSLIIKILRMIFNSFCLLGPFSLVVFLIDLNFWIWGCGSSIPYLRCVISILLCYIIDMHTNATKVLTVWSLISP